jgi:hypothetical protein
MSEGDRYRDYDPKERVVELEHEVEDLHRELDEAQRPQPQTDKDERIAELETQLAQTREQMKGIRVERSEDGTVERSLLTPTGVVVVRTFVVAVALGLVGVVNIHLAMVLAGVLILLRILWWRFDSRPRAKVRIEDVEEDGHDHHDTSKRARRRHAKRMR